MSGGGVSVLARWLAAAREHLPQATPRWYGARGDPLPAFPAGYAVHRCGSGKAAEFVAVEPSQPWRSHIKVRMISLPGVRARLWMVVTVAASAVLLLSLALPWASEWNGRRTIGASVLFVSDDHRPHVGAILLTLWSLAVVGTVRGTRAWWWLATVCAAAVVAICPVYYAVAITTSGGMAIGQDEQGNLVEWAIQSRVAPGLYVAAIGALLLCTGILMRCRAAGFGRRPDTGRSR